MSPHADAARLAVVRMVIGLVCLYTLYSYGDVVPFRGAEPGARFMPIGIVRFLDAPLSPAFAQGWQAATAMLAVAWTAGLKWRVTGPLFALLWLGWATWRLSFSGISHDLHIVTVHVLVLALVPAAAALSVDARWPGAAPGRLLTWNPSGPAADVYAAGGLRLVRVVTVITYFLAGLAKVEGRWNLDWARGEQLAGHLTIATLVPMVYRSEAEPAPLFALLVQNTWALTLAAGGTLLLELGAPVALLHRRVAWVWALGILGMHVGIVLGMRITFPYQTWGLALLAFVPVERLLPARLPPPRPRGAARRLRWRGPRPG